MSDVGVDRSFFRCGESRTKEAAKRLFLKTERKFQVA